MTELRAFRTQVMTNTMNPLALSDAKLAAIRDLQMGLARIDADGEIWESLAALGLVQPRQANVRVWALTALGQRYSTTLAPVAMVRSCVASDGPRDGTRRPS
jgi:hypothetical protein